MSELTTEFVSAFNSGDLDQIMSFFTEESFYIDSDGKEHHGLAEIRASFSKLPRGFKLIETDRVSDIKTDKVVSLWDFEIPIEKGKVEGRGLDILIWRNGKVIHKDTFAKSIK